MKQKSPPLEQSHLSSTEKILVHHKTNTEPWAWFKILSFQERNSQEFLLFSIVHNDNSKKLALKGGPHFWSSEKSDFFFKSLKFSLDLCVD